MARSLARARGDGPLVDRLAAPSSASSASAATSRRSGEAAGERHAAVVTLLELAEDAGRADPSAGPAAFLAEVERRSAIEAGGTPTGVELLTYHRAKGLEWDAVFLPALEEGTLPIRQADEPRSWPRSAGCCTSASPGRAGHLWLSWATRRTGTTGREGRRSRSRFLDGLVPPTGRPGRAPAAPGTRRDATAPRWTRASGRRCRIALRDWRTARARADAVAPFIVFHDTTIEAIAAGRPRSIAELRRVPGVGPTKLDRYGEEIIAVVVRDKR